MLADNRQLTRAHAVFVIDLKPFHKYSCCRHRPPIYIAGRCQCSEVPSLPFISCGSCLTSRLRRGPPSPKPFGDHSSTGHLHIQSDASHVFVFIRSRLQGMTQADDPCVVQSAAEAASTPVLSPTVYC
ncbi:hypothetical protein AB1N83_013398 [Pleurotus pulmonarius]